jgi:anti-anti-sigma regulatory factor
MSPWRLRWIDGRAVVDVGPRAVGQLVKPHEVAEICSHKPQVVFDLAGCVSSISALFGALLKARKQIHQIGGKVHLCCPTAIMQQALNIMRIDLLMPVFHSLDNALAAFDDEPAA